MHHDKFTTILAASLLFTAGCFESITSLAHDTFVRDTGCQVAEDVTMDEEHGLVEISGCEQHAEFNCVPGFNTTHHGPSPTSCGYRSRYAIVATDGVWQDDWNSSSLIRDAALQSAAHDIPCAASAVKPVDVLVVEGCGQRVSYHEVSMDKIEAPDSKSGYRITDASKLVLVGRITLKP